MPQREKDNMENFFQKASKNPNTEFNEGDWKKLEAMLDKERRKFVPLFWGRWKFVIAFIGSILLLSGAYFFIISNQQNLNTVAVHKNGIEKAANPISAGVLPDIKKPSPVRMQSSSEMQKRLPGAGIKSLIAGNSKKINEVVLKRAQPEHQIIIHETSENLTDKIVPTDVVKASGDNAKLPNTGEGVVLNKLTNTSESIKDSIANQEIAGISRVDPAFKKKTNQAPSRWSLVFSYAVEYTGNSVNLATSPGTVFGLAAHYHLNNKVSLSTGISKRNMKYWYSGNDASIPKNYWRNNTNGVVPDKIKGYCGILEVPLMLQYKLADRGKGKLLVSAGVSSYFILDESYQYIFLNPNPGSKEGWNTSKDSRFIFSSINASVGYEQTILPGMAIGIEPYIKIPTMGIGWPDIKLFSMGAAATLRYNIPKKKRFPISLNNAGPD
ncbi:MAG: hypothetical protein M0Q26_03050 [Chitinophagaceae bacterium]|nr:hypothetical protein [Chitinophagaceae bacterium]